LKAKSVLANRDEIVTVMDYFDENLEVAVGHALDNLSRALEQYSL